MKRLTIRAKVLLIAFAINALCTAVYTYYGCITQKAIFLDGVDDKLRAAAHALPLILPRDFHDNIEGPQSLDTASYHAQFRLTTHYALGIGIKFLYSMMERDGDFYECASSGSEREIKEGPDNQFFSKYEQPPASMMEAWKHNSERFEEYTDEFGRFRSIFVPMQSAQGTRYLVGADVSLDNLDKALQRIILHSVGLGLGIFIIVLVLSWLIVARILSPVAQLAVHARGLAQNDFRMSDELKMELQRMTESSQDEVGELAGAFREMAGKLEEYIENLKAATAAKERIESELRIAHDIQMSFLQKVFPPFPERDEFDLHAKLEPAKEVGGDLYDFFMLDDDHLLFYVGDVSGKGVPAALFMAVTMTLMKRTGQMVGVDPAEIIRQVNEELSAENENLMFVTLYCAILNLKTGDLHYSNAGHNPPIVVSPDGSTRWLELPHGPALGVMPGTPYGNMQTVMKPGEAIILYTDGVNEAMDVKGEQFGNEPFIELAGTMAKSAVEEMTTKVVASVHSHAGEAEQSDDITVLVMKLRDGKDA